MDRNSVSVIFLFLAIVGCIFLIEWVPYQAFSIWIDNLYQAIKADSYDMASNQLKEINTYWVKHRFWIGLENSFNKIEDIEISLSRIAFYLDNKLKASALLETLILDYHWYQLAK